MKRFSSNRSLQTVLLTLLVWCLPAVAVAQSAPLCYLVADNSGAADTFTTLDQSLLETAVGGTGTNDIEAIAFRAADGKLYVADADELGTIDLLTGAYQPIGRFGEGDGAAGIGRSFKDVDGLTVDPNTGALYGSVRKYNALDFLIQIDPNTGAAIKNAFGFGVDYLVIGAIAGLTDIDDLAIDPFDGTLYAVVSGGGDAHLATIDRATGSTTLLVTLDESNMEGLAFLPDGTLVGTTDEPSVVTIDRTTGLTTHMATLGAGGNYDYESLDCFAAPLTNEISGRVFGDLNEDGLFNGNDYGQNFASVHLYRDVNSNSLVDGTDNYLGTATTDSDGLFSFGVATTGDFVVAVDPSTLPAGATLLMGNTATASFSGLGEVDADNLFPYRPDAGAADLYCYTVADKGFNLQGGDVLTRINKATLLEEEVAPTGTYAIEAIAFNPQQTTLYAANGRRLGTLDLQTGAYTRIGKFGGGYGAEGFQSFFDIDGLAFDPNTGILYASFRRHGATDLLIQVDPLTAQAVPGVFNGDDYVVIAPIDGQIDIDDIAIDPFDGQLYGVQNGDGRNGKLVLIDKLTGATSNPLLLDQKSIEGLTFDGDGTLLGSLGNDDQELVSINRSSGTTTSLAALGVGGHRDYESLDCLTNQTNQMAGVVFADENHDGLHNGFERALPGVQVALYRDRNGNGTVDPDDALLATKTTDAGGAYMFDAASHGSFALQVMEHTLPAGATMTGRNAASAYFHRFGDRDANNNFGLSLAQATARTPALDLPTQHTLSQNYPNPFNPQTNIRFTLATATHVRLTVYDVMGREVAVLLEGMQAAGSHEAYFHATALPSGVYVYRLLTPTQTLSGMMTLAK